MRFWTKEEFKLVHDWLCQQKWYVQVVVGLFFGFSIGELIKSCA